MIRFLGISIFFVIAFGLMLHAGMELPAVLDWVGQLPGDLLIRKGNLVVYAPLASSLLIGAVVAFLLSLIDRKQN